MQKNNLWRILLRNIERPMLHRTNDIKQELSYLYVHALATKLGYSFERTQIDRDSVDATVCAQGRVLGSKAIIHSPKIDLQLKATSTEFDEDPMPFRLSMKNYDDLRVVTMVPKMLVILVLPMDENLWIRWSEAELALKGKAYWMSLRGKSFVPNSTSVTIHIPHENRLTDSSFREWMIAGANQEEIAYAAC